MTTPGEAADTKACPYCAEPIKSAAVFCKHCRTSLVGGVAPALATVPTYPAQQWAAPPATAGTGNGLAIASLVLGLVWLGGLGALLAVVFGHIARGQLARSNAPGSGRGIATAGLVLGYVGLVVSVIWVIAIAVATSNSCDPIYGC